MGIFDMFRRKPPADTVARPTISNWLNNPTSQYVSPADFHFPPMATVMPHPLPASSFDFKPATVNKAALGAFPSIATVIDKVQSGRRAF